MALGLLVLLLLFYAWLRLFPRPPSKETGADSVPKRYRGYARVAGKSSSEKHYPAMASPPTKPRDPASPGKSLRLV